MVVLAPGVFIHVCKAVPGNEKDGATKALKVYPIELVVGGSYSNIGLHENCSLS